MFPVTRRQIVTQSTQNNFNRVVQRRTDLFRFCHAIGARQHVSSGLRMFVMRVVLLMGLCAFLRRSALLGPMGVFASKCVAWSNGHVCVEVRCLDRWTFLRRSALLGPMGIVASKCIA